MAMRLPEPFRATSGIWIALLVLEDTFLKGCQNLAVQPNPAPVLRQYEFRLQPSDLAFTLHTQLLFPQRKAGLVYQSIHHLINTQHLYAAFTFRKVARDEFKIDDKITHRRAVE